MEDVMPIPSPHLEIVLAEALRRYGFARGQDWTLQQAYEEVAAEMKQLVEIDRTSDVWASGKA
jgi:hypothetical protein